MDSILAILVKDTEVMACMTYQCHHGKPDTQTNAIVTVQEQKGLAVAMITNGSHGRNKQPDHYALVMTGTGLLDWMADPEKAVFNGETECVLRYISCIRSIDCLLQQKIVIGPHHYC